MLYAHTEEPGTPSPNGSRSTWINSLMSDSHYSVLNDPSQRVAVIIRRWELITDEALHTQLLPLWPTPERFFNVVGRIACAIAETRPKDSGEVHDSLNCTIRMMVGYATDSLKTSMVGNQHQETRVHVVDCARNLARYMPGGLWSDFQFQVERPDAVIYTGVRHDVDYR